MHIEIIEGEFSDRGRALCYNYIKQMYLRMMQNEHRNIYKGEHRGTSEAWVQSGTSNDGMQKTSTQ